MLYTEVSMNCCVNENSGPPKYCTFDIWPVTRKRLPTPAIIHPYLPYALPAWGSTYPTNVSKLCILQNKAIKLICDGKKSDNVTPY